MADDNSKKCSETSFWPPLGSSRMKGTRKACLQLSIPLSMLIQVHDHGSKNIKLCTTCLSPPKKIYQLALKHGYWKSTVVRRKSSNYKWLVFNINIIKCFVYQIIRSIAVILKRPLLSNIASCHTSNFSPRESSSRTPSPRLPPEMPSESQRSQNWGDSQQDLKKMKKKKCQK